MYVGGYDNGNTTTTTLPHRSIAWTLLNCQTGEGVGMASATTQFNGSASASVPAGVAAAINAAKDELPQADLYGECPYNARRLHDELKQRGYQAKIVRGGCSPTDQPCATTIKQAIDRGVIHWWVQVRFDGQWHLADLATEVESHRGETIVRQDAPTEYTALRISPPNTEAFASR